MIEVRDGLDRKVRLAQPARRIVSLVPSWTETLAHLGLDEETVGITKFCVKPDNWYRSKVRIGGTKSVKTEAVLALDPDLIIANREENQRDQVEALAAQCPVYTSVVKDLFSACKAIVDIGKLSGKEEEAERLSSEILTRFTALESRIDRSSRRALYLIWRDPFMAAGGDTFIDAMIAEAGWHNVLHDQARYPELTIEEMQGLLPDLVLLSSEPFPFRQRHCVELQSALPESTIFLVDGTYFSWYGSRLLDSPRYLESLLVKAAK